MASEEESTTSSTYMMLATSRSGVITPRRTSPVPVASAAVVMRLEVPHVDATNDAYTKARLMSRARMPSPWHAKRANCRSSRPYPRTTRTRLKSSVIAPQTAAYRSVSCVEMLRVNLAYVREIADKQAQMANKDTNIVGDVLNVLGKWGGCLCMTCSPACLCLLCANAVLLMWTFTLLRILGTRNQHLYMFLALGSNRSVQHTSWINVASRHRA